MKRIMFNDKFYLTNAVIDGSKTMTRRACIISLTEKKTMKDVQIDNIYLEDMIWMFSFKNKCYPLPKINYPKYKVGEIIAVLQKYTSISDISKKFPDKVVASPGYRNKMFVKSEHMPYAIKITNIRAERLQDISDEDCIAEGVKKAYIGYYVDGLKCRDCRKEPHTNRANGTCKLFQTPRSAFASLIDKISGKASWAANKWQWVYDFELIKK